MKAVMTGIETVAELHVNKEEALWNLSAPNADGQRP